MYAAYFEYSQDIFDRAVKAIREAEPALVVVTQPPPGDRMRSEDFQELLLNRYEIVKVVEPTFEPGVPIVLYRRKGTS